MRLFFVSLLSIFSIFSASGQLRTARVFADHMVLQRDKPAPVWGWAKPGETITVALNGQSKRAKTDRTTGRWRVELDPMPAGGPYALDISSSGGDRLSISDVLVGEVWLCSGQSNMEWTVAESANAAAEIRRGSHPTIRHFKVAHDVQLGPQDDIPTESSKTWVVCSPATVGEFTAVGYAFARAIREKIGEDVPVGLLHSSWGGSQVEGWISRSAMQNNEVFRAYGSALPADWAAANALLEQRVLHHCFGPEGQKPSAEVEATYTQAGFDFEKWPAGYAPGAWDWQGIWAFRGRGYMARYIDLPADLAGAEATLFLGKNDQLMEVFVNGQLIERGTQRGVIKVKVPKNILKSGKNALMLHIGSQSDPEWWAMGLHGSGSDIRLDIGGESLPLDGDGWQNMPAWNQRYSFARLNNNLGTTIFNAMIHPLVPYGVRGVLWYQGESNASRAYEYRESFPLLIKDWRKQWDETLPFYFVQLSSFGDNQNSNLGSNWAELREAQTLALRLPETGMAITTDIGDADDIHPTNKQDVGRRLANLALSDVYAVASPRSPSFRSVVWEAASAILIFDETGEGLVARDKFGYVRGFEVAGEDRKFHYAQAQIINGNQIVVLHPEGQKPVAVRYAWADAPTDANVFNSAGLPLGTFRTDDWDGRTKGKKFE
jgi:sialate O-acetylesterase